METTNLMYGVEPDDYLPNRITKKTIFNLSVTSCLTHLLSSDTYYCRLKTIEDHSWKNTDDLNIRIIS